MSSCNTGLTEETLAEVADLRARGSSWDATARAVGWDTPDLRRALRGAPDAFERFYADAERDVRRETEAELLLKLRAQLRDPDTPTARKAAEALAKHIAAERRDRARLDVEKLRAETARAKLNAKRTTDDPDADPPLNWPAATPEEVHRPDQEDTYARRAANTQAVVWLWGGAHKIGCTEPDPATDTPLVLLYDMTVQGRNLYWATRFPIPGNPMNGSYPVPGVYEPVPELTPEQAQQLAALATTTPVA